MGKAAKAHRAKVLKRNLRLQHTERKISKEWNTAMQEQMEKFREEFAKMSADTENNLVEDATIVDENTNTTTEPVGSVQGN
jgi:hypothetical protein